VQGYAQRVAEIRGGAPEGIRFAGASFDGVGIPDCVRSGTEVARAILEQRPG
jgi:protoporphyrinogen oxidase